MLRARNLPKVSATMYRSMFAEVDAELARREAEKSKQTG